MSIEQVSMCCGSSMSRLTSGQPVKDNNGLLQVCVQVLLAHLPNIESTCRVFFAFLFFVLHCIFNSNVNCYVSIKFLLQSSLSLFIFIVLYVYSKLYTAECKC